MYLFDQVLSFISGINPLAAIILVLTNIKKIFIENINNNKFTFLVLFLTYSLLIYISIDDTSTKKSLFSLFVFVAIFLIIDKNNLYRILIKSNINHQILKVIFLFLLIDYFLMFNFKDYFTGAVRGAGLFNEKSHLALYSLPLIMYSILHFRSILPYILIVFIILFFNSLTLVIGLMMFYSILFIKTLIHRPLKSLKYIAIILTIIYFIILQWDFFYARIEGILIFLENLNKAENLNSKELETYLSGLIWVNGWIMAYDNLIYSNYLGLGFNNMGINENAGLTLSKTSTYDPALLNAQDGSFLASKIISELGIFGIIILFYLTLKSIKNIFTFIANQNKELDTYIYISLKFTSSILLLSYLYVRGIGYFQLPFLLYIHLFLLDKSVIDYENVIKKE